MRHYLAILLLVVPLCLAWSQESISTSLDLCSIDSVFADTALVRMQVSLSITDEFGLGIPLSLVAERVGGAPMLWETGLFLEYHPLSSGLFLSLSLMQVALLSNHPYEEEPQVLFLNEMAFGWEFSVPPSFVVTPCLVIKDPNRIFIEEYEQLGSLFSRFPMVRFALLVGWRFPVPSPKAAVQ